VSAIDHAPRPERVFVGGELEILLSDLDYHRSTLLWKCEGLTDEQLRFKAVGRAALVPGGSSRDRLLRESIDGAVGE
jgi:hypothetical protein